MNEMNELTMAVLAVAAAIVCAVLTSERSYTAAGVWQFLTGVFIGAALLGMAL